MTGPNKPMTKQVQVVSLAAPYLVVSAGMYLFHNAWCTFIAYHACIVTFLVVYRKPGLIKKLFCGWNWYIAAVLSALSVMLILLALGIRQHVMLESTGLMKTLSGFGLGNISFYIFAALFVSAHPVLEELFWRSFHWGPCRTHWPVDIIFAGYHILVLTFFVKWPGLLFIFAAISLAALLWRFCGQKLNGLATILFAHVIADISILVSAYLLTNGPGG